MENIKERFNGSAQASRNQRLSFTYISKPLSTPFHSYRSYVHDTGFVVPTPTSLPAIRNGPGVSQRYTDKNGQFVYFVVSGSNAYSNRDRLNRKYNSSTIDWSSNRSMRENLHSHKKMTLVQDTANGLRLGPVSYAWRDGTKNPPASPTASTSLSDNSIAITGGSISQSSKNRKEKWNKATRVKVHRMEPCKPSTIELPSIHCSDNGKCIRRTTSRSIPSKLKNKEQNSLENKLPVLIGKGLAKKSMDMRENIDHSEYGKTSKSNINDNDTMGKQKSSFSSKQRKNVIELKVAKVDIALDACQKLLKTAISEYDQNPTTAKQRQLSNLLEKFNDMNSEQDNTTRQNDVQLENRSMANSQETSRNVVCHRSADTAIQYHENEECIGKTRISERAVNNNREKDVAAFYRKLSEVLGHRYRDVNITPVPQTCFRMMLPVM